MNNYIMSAGYTRKSIKNVDLIKKKYKWCLIVERIDIGIVTV